MHIPTPITVSDNVITIQTATIDARLSVDPITGRVTFLDSSMGDAKNIAQIKTYLSVENKNLLDREISTLSSKSLTKAWTNLPTGPDIADGAGQNFIISYRDAAYPLKSAAMLNQNHNVCNFKKYSLSTEGPAGDFLTIMALPETHGPDVSHLVPSTKPYNFNLSISCFEELSYGAEAGYGDADRTIGLKPQYNAVPNIKTNDKTTYNVNANYKISPFIGACRVQTFDAMKSVSTSFHPSAFGMGGESGGQFEYPTASPPEPKLLSASGGPINEAQNQHFLITTVYTGAHAALPAEITLQIILNKATKDKIALIAIGSTTLGDFYQNLKDSKDTSLTSLPEYQAILAALMPKTGGIVSSNYTDTDITKGFYNAQNRFFVKELLDKASFKIGDQVSFADGSLKTIIDVQEHSPNVHYFYEGKHLDPSKVAGKPMKKLSS